MREWEGGGDGASHVGVTVSKLVESRLALDSRLEGTATRLGGRITREGGVLMGDEGSSARADVADHVEPKPSCRRSACGLLNGMGSPPSLSLTPGVCGAGSCFAASATQSKSWSV